MTPTPPGYGETEWDCTRCNGRHDDEHYMPQGCAEVRAGQLAFRDPTAFWSSLSPAQALALLRAAPKVAGPWVTLHEVGDAERKPVHSFRKTIDDGKVASVYSAPNSRTDWSAWMTESDSYERCGAPSHDDGKRRADAALRAAGWLLVDE